MTLAPPSAAPARTRSLWWARGLTIAAAVPTVVALLFLFGLWLVSVLDLPSSVSSFGWLLLAGLIFSALTLG
ncbi:hypothetical protein FLP10_10835 [Agromyces intestinalis]|uniref:Uncharacterized protein n=1 Tax=Agromyces intestinalis TaxID=2592652 RepID=A0A5C1YGW0_9MICO|nr:hypothetical protein [Agromyces intestinalis]QEO14848.1 hypothetical protein FLP10_10835 [Agromyces intestinalis]